MLSAGAEHFLYIGMKISDWVCVKTGRGGFWTHIAKWYIYFFWCPKYSLLLIFYWYFEHFGSGPWGVHFEIARAREPGNSRRRWICRAAGGLLSSVPFVIYFLFCFSLWCYCVFSICCTFFGFVFLCGAIVYCFEEHMPLPASRGG